jgi:hypothetical protein
MQTHYQLNMDDIMTMSWRRFSVLFHGIFKVKDGEETFEGSLPAENQKGGSKRSYYEQAVHEASGASGSIQHSFDWDAAHNRPGPENREILTSADLLARGSGEGKNVEM